MSLKYLGVFIDCLIVCVFYYVVSYLILAPAAMQAEKDIKKAAECCMDAVKLDPESYRLGHTKARK